MKKLLALALAVLTLAVLPTASFAATVYKAPSYPVYVGGNTGYYYPTYPSAGENTLFPYIPYGYGFSYGGAPVSGGYYPYVPDTEYGPYYWIGECQADGCDGAAFFFIDDNQINWFCPKCRESGVITREATNLPIPDYGYDSHDAILCQDDNCTKTARIDHYRLEANGKVSAIYVCEDKHESVVKVEGNFYYGYHPHTETRAFTVAVESSSAGEYAISGLPAAAYGEEKTVAFYPYTGYTLAAVFVNGIEVPVTDNKVTFRVYDNTVVIPYYVRTSYPRAYAINVTVNGNGTVSALRNGISVPYTSMFTATSYDTVVLNFTPGAATYGTVDVRVDGKSIGPQSSYRFTNLNASHNVEVTFGWNNPYADVDAGYLSAVEYVTEAGLMGAYRTSNGNKYFYGRTAITVGDLVCALAELTDTGDVLNSDKDRIDWAVRNGVIPADTDTKAACTVKKACTIVRDYLIILEIVSGVRFTNLIRNGTARENAISLNLATGAIYDYNRTLHRYDLAAICRLIARLEYR